MQGLERKVPLTFYVRPETIKRLEAITRFALEHDVFEGRISVSRIGAELVEKYLDEFEQYVKKLAEQRVTSNEEIGTPS